MFSHWTLIHDGGSSVTFKHTKTHTHIDTHTHIYIYIHIYIIIILYSYIYIYIYIYKLLCMYIYIYIYIYGMVFTTEGLFEVATESWPEWDLDPRPLNSIQML